MNDFVMSDEDLALMFPEKKRTASKTAPTSEPPLLKTADAILAAADQEARISAPAPAPKSKPAGPVVVYADEASTSASPSESASAVVTPELAELRAIRAELTSLCALVATGVNKMGRK